MKRLFLMPLLLGAAHPPLGDKPGDNDVRYAKPEAWVLAPPAPTTSPDAADAPVRVVYFDNQARMLADGEQVYSAYRLKILKPEGLAAGNLALNWTPGTGSVTVHQLRIVRDGKPIDVLAGTKFQILRREDKLEQAMLTGQLTAALQVPGLQVGDELEFAATVVQREPTFGGHVADIAQLPVLGMPGAFRFRFVWPEARAVTWRVSKDLTATEPTLANGEKQLVYEMRDPLGALATEGAPARYNVRRLLQFSDFASWSAISAQFWPLYQKAAQIAPDSPLRAEIAKIAQASADPRQRAQAALALVQDQIRYVYVGLNGGNYLPPSADETWKRRFGDCKAKTALLLALLRELGVEAEPVLVNSSGGDGLDERLPSPRMFDHILVRARIAGRSYWLDGTRLGDRDLDSLPPVGYRWGLPLSQAGTELASIPPADNPVPQYVGLVDIDARAGMDADARVKLRTIVRGDEAQQMRRTLAALSKSDADRALNTYWRQQAGWVEPETVAWKYDERQAAIVLDLGGTGALDWSGDATDGYSYTLPSAGFYPPEYMRRPKDQDQTAPWAIEFPAFRCYATTVRLPAESGKWRWTYDTKDMNQTIAGATFWRSSGLSGGVIRMVKSRRSLMPEISAAEAVQVNRQIPKFNNNMLSVYQADKATDPKPPSVKQPFGDDTDWLNNAAPCNAPPAAPAAK